VWAQSALLLRPPDWSSSPPRTAVSMRLVAPTASADWPLVTAQIKIDPRVLRRAYDRSPRITTDRGCTRKTRLNCANHHGSTPQMIVNQSTHDPSGRWLVLESSVIGRRVPIAAPCRATHRTRRTDCPELRGRLVTKHHRDHPGCWPRRLVPIPLTDAQIVAMLLRTRHPGGACRAIIGCGHNIEF
jgi:hypothetical protein